MPTTTWKKTNNLVGFSSLDHFKKKKKKIAILAAYSLGAILPYNS